MDFITFFELPLEEKIPALYKHGTFVVSIRYYGYKINLYMIDGHYVEVFYNHKLDKIEKIERSGYSRSIVTLKSGRELELRGSNDVNDDNKGIIVTVEGLGRVDLKWEDFESVTFKDAPGSGMSYSEFNSPQKIVAKVEVDNGDVLEGEIVYDLDEEYSFEVLNGRDDDTKYVIPFRNIKSIEPRSADRATVELKDSSTIVLEDSQDVSEKNQGILVKTGSDNVYVPWERVRKVTMR